MNFKLPPEDVGNKIRNKLVMPLMVLEEFYQDKKVPKEFIQSAIHELDKVADLSWSCTPPLNLPQRKDNIPVSNNRKNRLKILLAEDYPRSQRMIKKMILRWGYQADVVSTGEEAVNRAKVLQYDLCLLDTNMPVMDGLEACRSIRRELRYVPIMGLTVSPGERHECFEAGMDDLLEKPVEAEQLYQKIIELTIKAVKIEKKEGKLEIIKEPPVDKKELEELRELRKKGLGIFVLRGSRERFVTHINLQNKVSHDFAEGKILSEFLDRSEDLPGNVHLYYCNMHANQSLLIPEEMQERIKSEDEEFKKYTNKAEYPEKK